jgi:NTF2 fold immunity protein
VPNAEAAKQIARTIWTPIYGAEEIVKQEPLQAELKFNVWIVTGSAASEDVLFAFILQADGRILSMGYGPVTR